MRNTVFASLLLVCSVWVNVCHADERFSAGFIDLSATEQTPPMGVWYPSKSEETDQKLGPFDVKWAWKGEGADGLFPIVVLSHGLIGRYRNHWHTAVKLARNGYIVVGPDHLNDRQMHVTHNIVTALTLRAKELTLALSTIRTHPIVGKIADADRVGAVGYSLGTLTSLYAAGITPQMSNFHKHCQRNHSRDNNFCRYGWKTRFFLRVQSVLAWFKGAKNRNSESIAYANAGGKFSPIPSPINFSAMALVAPVGVSFPEKKLRRQNADVALFRLGDDEQLRYPYHAENLNKLLGEKARVYKTFEGVHHYAFIAPFPQWLLDTEYIPVAIDPEGFDRSDFIRDINKDIVSFFNRYL